MIVFLQFFCIMACMRNAGRITGNNRYEKTGRTIMNRLILYIAMSLDGYIAEKDGTIGF